MKKLEGRGETEKRIRRREGRNKIRREGGRKKGVK